MRRAAALVLAAAWTLVPACAPKGDPVRKSLDAIVQAANARDADRLFENVSSSFQAADGSGLADAKAMVGRYFAAYEILTVTVRDVQVERGEGAARVRLRAELSGQPRKVGGLSGLLPTASSYDFDLRLTLEDGRWKIAWAQWNVASARSGSAAEGRTGLRLACGLDRRPPSLAAAPAARGVRRCARGDPRAANYATSAAGRIYSRPVILSLRMARADPGGAASVVSRVASKDLRSSFFGVFRMPAHFPRFP